MQPVDLIIFGASGDLSARKLFPALFQLDRAGLLPLDLRIAAIARDKGVPGVFDYLRDLHDDPQPNFKLKVLLAGPSMAGKSSILNRLLGKLKVLTERDTERTIGLHIAPGVVLLDPQGRAPHGIVLVVYDAGGARRVPGDAAGLRDTGRAELLGLGPRQAPCGGPGGAGVSARDGGATGSVGADHPVVRARLDGACLRLCLYNSARAACQSVSDCLSTCCPRHIL